jgi:hypothetical protein
MRFVRLLVLQVINNYIVKSHSAWPDRYSYSIQQTHSLRTVLLIISNLVFSLKTETDPVPDTQCHIFLLFLHKTNDEVHKVYNSRRGMLSSVAYCFS